MQRYSVLAAIAMTAKGGGKNRGEVNMIHRQLIFDNQAILLIVLHGFTNTSVDDPSWFWAGVFCYCTKG